ncbi:unnamed protein product [Phytophthora fragariaefolia]|uniref:Unnamed protein product n=1 Tax=Phytophthora fragariaefolia TaxID=1490495 RepID=A0A9W6XRC3_9STRA|nr:unnamed protein product [Phytophthora fragariaefolia]
MLFWEGLLVTSTQPRWLHFTRWRIVAFPSATTKAFDGSLRCSTAPASPRGVPPHIKEAKLLKKAIDDKAKVVIMDDEGDEDDGGNDDEEEDHDEWPDFCCEFNGDESFDYETCTNDHGAVSSTGGDYGTSTEFTTGGTASDDSVHSDETTNSAQTAVAQNEHKVEARRVEREQRCRDELAAHEARYLTDKAEAGERWRQEKIEIEERARHDNEEAPVRTCELMLLIGALTAQQIPAGGLGRSLTSWLDYTWNLEGPSGYKSDKQSLGDGLSFQRLSPECCARTTSSGVRGFDFWSLSWIQYIHRLGGRQTSSFRTPSWTPSALVALLSSRSTILTVQPLFGPVAGRVRWADKICEAASCH